MLLGYYTSWPIIATASVVAPAYQTFKAVKAEDTKSKDRWLQYWMIFSLVAPVFWVLDMVSAFVPLYFELKVAFMLWLTLDRFAGATKLSTVYVLPALAQNQEMIDSNISFISARLQNFKPEDLRTLVEWGKAQGECIMGAAGGAACEGEASKAKAPGAKAEKPASPTNENTTETTGAPISEEEKKAQ